MTPHLVISIVAYVATLGLTLLWVYGSSQSTVARTWRRTLSIALRMAFVFAAFWWLLSGVSLSTFATVLAVFVGLFFLAPLLVPWSALLGGSLGDAALLALLLFVYLIQQWVLGWPDKEKIVLCATAPRTAKPDETWGHLQGKLGTVASPLRPGGSVRIDGQEYQARSEHGFVDGGMPVEVVGVSSFGVTVRTTDGEMSESNGKE